MLSTVKTRKALEAQLMQASIELKAQQQNARTLVTKEAEIQAELDRLDAAREKLQADLEEARQDALLDAKHQGHVDELSADLADLERDRADHNAQHVSCVAKLGKVNSAVHALHGQIVDIKRQLGAALLHEAAKDLAKLPEFDRLLEGLAGRFVLVAQRNVSEPDKLLAQTLFEVLLLDQPGVREKLNHYIVQLREHYATAA